MKLHGTLASALERDRAAFEMNQSAQSAPDEIAKSLAAQEHPVDPWTHPPAANHPPDEKDLPKIKANSLFWTYVLVLTELSIAYGMLN